MQIVFRGFVALGCVVWLATLVGRAHAVQAPAQRLLAAGEQGASAWTFQGEQTAIVREERRDGARSESRSTLRTWFSPGVGWRMEIDSTGSVGERQRSFGSDGATLWSYDPVTNRYTVQPAGPGFDDPRFLTVAFGPTTGTTDLASALAAFQQSPYGTFMLEGTQVVAGRVAQVILTSPYRCVGPSSSASATTSASGTTTSATTTTVGYCEGTVRYWLDSATGWVLQAEGDDGNGGGFLLDTVSAIFDGSINSALFSFTPPPGSIQVDFLN